MKTEIQTKQNASLQVDSNYTAEKIELIKNTVALGATNIELQFFVEQCKRTGLDPVTRQIYFIKDGNGKVHIQTSIDGLRLIADRSNDYEGQAPAQWCGKDGKWNDVWLSPEPPAAARVGVWKKGFREPLYAVALFSEYAQMTVEYENNRKTDRKKLNYIWGSKPALMLSKVAEALALRKAFPNDMSGIYSTDEYTPDSDQPKSVTSVERIVAASEPIEVETKKIEPPKEEIKKETPKTETQKPMIPPYVIKFGKYKGMDISSVNLDDLISYSSFLLQASNEANKPLNANAQEFVNAVEEIKSLGN